MVFTDWRALFADGRPATRAAAGWVPSRWSESTANLRLEIARYPLASELYNRYNRKKSTGVPMVDGYDSGEELLASLAR